MFISATCQLSLQAVPPCNCIRPSDIRLYHLTRLSARSPVVAAAWRVFSPLYIELQILQPALSQSKPRKQDEEQHPW